MHRPAGNGQTRTLTISDLSLFTPLAVARASTVNVRRLALLAAYSVACLALRLIGLPVPMSAFAVFGAWTASALVYHSMLRRTRTRHAADRIQLFAFAADVTFLSVMFSLLGGGWWIGGTIHGFILTFAFASLPRQLAKIIAGYTVVAFFALIAAQTFRATGPSFGGVPAIAGNYRIAVAIALLGGVSLIALAIVQYTFVRIMRRSQERYRTLFETVPGVIMSTDLSGTITAANEAAYRLAGPLADDLVGMPLGEILGGSEMNLRAHLRAAQLGEVREFVVRVITPNESVKWLECTCKPVREDGKITGVLFVGRDITRERQDEEALRKSQEQVIQSQKMEAVGQLAGGLAHDFNNLLSIITGYTGLLRKSLDSDDARQADIKEIQLAAESASSLTRQLLAFGRKQVLQLTVVDINSTVEQVERMLRRLIGDRIQVVTKLDDSLRAVKADPGQLEQIVMNLAVNSRDAMPEGGTLTIETENVYLDEDYARTHTGVRAGLHVALIIRDTGVGMDAATQARIFEPFFTTKEAGRGTGLGLASVYGIVQQSGGHIWVYSEPGCGTVFKIYFPATGEEAQQYHHGPKEPDENLSGDETILVVDDSESLRPIVVRILREYGYAVLEARTGDQALQIAKSYDKPIDLLLTDVVMPGLTGPRLAEELAMVRPGLRTLFMSGYSDSAAAGEGIIQSGSGFLEKPFTPETLARQVRRALEAVASDSAGTGPPAGARTQLT